ncbi:hypothetical protein DPEC_G00168660 [Dallia pectoralis]|uniref:Uncharacterized protein n=1 Tax=Dallia pectoralis TaxID=75939 RepID=A0ACC2GCF6_DALPE|nr:hypothetical protein DPEC_G00168660 [Dallia pectoralis]
MRFYYRIVITVLQTLTQHKAPFTIELCGALVNLLAPPTQGVTRSYPEAGLNGRFGKRVREFKSVALPTDLTNAVDILFSNKFLAAQTAVETPSE